MSVTFTYAQQRAIVKSNPQKIVNNAKPTPGFVDFEDITDFALTFDPWTVNDVDGSTTYGIQDVTFPNSGTAMAFLCFNPLQTTPALGEDWYAHSGDKYGACFASTTPDNNDWFISPQVALPMTDAEFSFWAKSITDQYGLERFNVAVSTTDNNPASFTVISGATYIEAPVTWTEYVYDLSAYAGQNVYVAIQCVSHDAFCFQIDDISLTAGENALFSDDFESYTAGEYLALNSDVWTTWSNNPGSSEDALVLEEQSHSATKAPKIDGSTDLILPLGNKTSGKYHVTWYMYIPSGNAGYYNFQKFENPGNEWAFEVYFGNNNHASVRADSDTSNVGFSFNHDEWFEMNNVIDLDIDTAWLYYNGNLVHKWQYSVKAGGDPGTLQLGGIDFYAGGTDPVYYFDDIVYVEDVPPSTNPVINVSTDPITSIVDPGSTTTETLNIANDGGGDLDYNIVVTYPAATAKYSIPTPILNNTFKKNSVEFSLAPNAVPALNNPATKDEVLHYDGDNSSAIGLNSPGEFRVAAMFPAAMVAPYIGMEINSVDLYINDAPNFTKILIYDMGSSNVPGPGDLLYEQDFIALPGEWNHVILTTPLKLTGADIWVGYLIDQPDGAYCAGCDAGPHNPNGDWISIGPGWSHLSDNAALDYNWNIRANLSGTPSINWLSVTPASGTIAAGENSDITLNIDGTLLTEPEYHATLILRSNDLENERIEIPVNLTVTVGINENTTYNTLIYPNPAYNYVIIKSEKNINRVSIFNYVGQMISENVVDNNIFKINTAEYKTGVYLVKIETTEGLITKKLYIK